MSLHLILGGARSGKSSFAEKQAKYTEEYAQSQVYYVATAQSLDGEMSARIKQHQLQRPEHWVLIESPIKLANAIKQLVLKHQSEYETPITVLVDCLTLWLSNCLCSMDKNTWKQEKEYLLNVLSDYAQTNEVNLMLVSNEVGHGIVPMGELSRNFVDQAGWLHQEIATIATDVDFIMAGIALSLKSMSLKSKEQK
ncbi:bifunctional adenosylcobinamide kinase/adenosylcobinamide-phosphate guanylyltransferase [Candidatus Colwellia aromaticivorans]|uniref:bifunctional adenosylcobinamide kinase/adenosylcobinamide-phosphate guanylyltransferase n=1 Tax=Candidatus Colwellia aromaticivorans TaxID=2267621 RepID=UPI000DF47C66|nr:bifunctional adenosylcobinamide kinase/adenosylcobinamide-phosphate guanylyltransferase [Candidatus Colwellia aromaticivorans]